MRALWCSLVLGLTALWLPGISIAQPAGPEIDVIPASILFSGTQVGSSTSGSFAIINMGLGDLVVSDIAVTSGDSDFSVDFGLAAPYCLTSSPVIPGVKLQIQSDTLS